MWSASGGNGIGVLVGIAEPFLEGSEFLFKSANGVTDIRQSFECHQLSGGFSDGARRCSKICLTAGHVAMHPCLRSDDRTVADVDVISDTDLTGTDDVVTGGYGSGESDLRDEEVVATDVTVMADHDLIIDAGARADHGFTDFGAVDGRTGSDFHIVTDANDAEVGQPQVPTIDQSIAEAIGSDDTAGVDNDVVADVYV